MIIDKQPWNSDYNIIFGPTQPVYFPDTKPVPPNSTVIPPEAAKKIKDQLRFNTAVKADQGKPDVTLVPYEAVEEIAKVLEFGAKKYSRDNWKAGSGFKYTRVIASLLRHVFAYLRGEDKDPESGLSHIAHAGCNVMFILYYEKYKNKYSNDDRV